MLEGKDRAEADKLMRLREAHLGCRFHRFHRHDSGLRLGV